MKKSLSIDAIVAQAQYQLRRLGWQAALGLGLVLASMALFGFMVYPAMQTHQAESARVLSLQCYVKQHPVALKPVAPPLGLEQQFYAILPTQKEANRELAQILYAVDQVGLSVNGVEYSAQPYANAMVKYQIKLPVQGTYTQVRQLINLVFAALPSLALTNVDFRRDDIASDVINTNLYFTLYLRQLAHS